MTTKPDTFEGHTPGKIEIVFDGPPEATAGRFVEVEQDGKGKNFGEWRKRDDGYWVLEFDDPATILAERDALAAAVVENVDSWQEIRDEVLHGGNELREPNEVLGLLDQIQVGGSERGRKILAERDRLREEVETFDQERSLLQEQIDEQREDLRAADETNGKLLGDLGSLRSQLAELREAARETEDSLHTAILAIHHEDWNREETINILRGANKRLRAAPIYEESEE